MQEVYIHHNDLFIKDVSYPSLDGQDRFYGSFYHSNTQDWRKEIGSQLGLMPTSNPQVFIDEELKEYKFILLKKTPFLKKRGNPDQGKVRSRSYLNPYSLEGEFSWEDRRAVALFRYMMKNTYGKAPDPKSSILFVQATRENLASLEDLPVENPFPE